MAEQTTTEADRLSVRQLAIGQLVGLRARQGAPGFAGHIERVTGLALPTQPNTRSVDATQQLLWIGPDEWWWLDTARSRSDRVARLLSEAPGPMAAVELGAAHSLLSVSGTAAAEALSRGCPIDLHPRRFLPTQVVGSVFFKAEIRLWRRVDAALPPGFELIVRRSMAAYVRRLLAPA
ncbi:MAG: sarcosine oxidase subunit gamma family protein [Burkholderiaceae bacterium]